MGEQTENLLAYLTGRDQPVKAKYREARRSFWAYCKLMNPGFFREDRPHLRELAETLQALEEGTLYAPDGSVCRRVAALDGNAGENVAEYRKARVDLRRVDAVPHALGKAAG